MTNLKRLRKEKYLTANELAEKSGVKVTNIRKYELEERDINKASGITLYQLSKALDCTIEELLEIEDMEKEM